MGKRSKRGKTGGPIQTSAPRSYLRRLTPMALVFLPFWVLLPFLVNPDRIELIFSGTVAAWRLLLMAAFVVLASYASSACMEWEERRKARARR
jgi:hypothetical protein